MKRAVNTIIIIECSQKGSYEIVPIGEKLEVLCVLWTDDDDNRIWRRNVYNDLLWILYV